MLGFLMGRFGRFAITLWLVSIIVFALMETMPCGPFGPFFEYWSDDSRCEIEYLLWTGGVFQGDLGYSFNQVRPVTDIIGHRIWYSATLVALAFLAAVPTAVLFGIWAGVRAGSVGDRMANTVGRVGTSLPEVVTGPLLIVLFASILHLLPSISQIKEGANQFTDPKILILPTLTLTPFVFAYIMRETRANVVEVMHSPCVRTAILKGLPKRRIVLRHVVPNALLPTISPIAQAAGWLLGGLVVVESLFGYPGIGSLLWSAVSSDDRQLLQALVLIIAWAYAMVNLLADLLSGLLDPRVRVPGSPWTRESG